MKIIFITDAILFTILLAGCASEQVNISSMPPGALVSIDGRRVGVTPFTAEFISHRTYSVKAVKDGYMAVEMKSCHCTIASRIYDPEKSHEMEIALHLRLCYGHRHHVDRVFV